jgi:hypothetical protein
MIILRALAIGSECIMQRIWKDFRLFYLSLTAQNIFDVNFYDSKGAVCPGRFITLEAGVKF